MSPRTKAAVDAASIAGVSLSCLGGIVQWSTKRRSRAPPRDCPRRRRRRRRRRARRPLKALTRTTTGGIEEARPAEGHDRTWQWVLARHGGPARLREHGGTRSDRRAANRFPGYGGSQWTSSRPGAVLCPRYCTKPRMTPMGRFRAITPHRGRNVARHRRSAQHRTASPGMAGAAVSLWREGGWSAPMRGPQCAVPCARVSAGVGPTHRGFDVKVLHTSCQPVIPSGGTAGISAGKLRPRPRESGQGGTVPTPLQRGGTPGRIVHRRRGGSL